MTLLLIENVLSPPGPGIVVPLQGRCPLLQGFYDLSGEFTLSFFLGALGAERQA
jgi:hypothetical protein